MWKDTPSGALFSPSYRTDIFAVIAVVRAVTSGCLSFVFLKSEKQVLAKATKRPSIAYYHTESTTF
jgi:hypothetical protein